MGASYQVTSPHRTGRWGFQESLLRFFWLFPLRVFRHLPRCSLMTCIPGRPTAQTVSFPPCPGVLLVQVAKLCTTDQIRFTHQWFHASCNPSQCNALRIVKVQTVSAVWRFRLMSTFHFSWHPSAMRYYYILTFWCKKQYQSS